jgi:hypothetical protein
MITTDKFYLFDVGVANYLMRRQPRIGSPEFGKAFEHYRRRQRTGDRSQRLIPRPRRRYQAADGAARRRAGQEMRVVCLEKRPRQIATGIEVIPWKIFIKQLRDGAIS